MRNADEHKKLLAQIAELEKSSVNYFDVEKEFFLIDSNNLSQVRPKLYGYSIQETGIYEDDNLTHEAIANLDGRGCYVYVDVRDGKITIKQDLNGCWGIYLFRHGDYFALSNSFFRLLDHIKFKYPLTVNKDYVYYLATDILCSITYSETIVNEIQIIDRSAVIYIDILEKDLQTQLIDYKEYSVLLDSENGIATLDRWVELWGNVFRGVAQHTKFITADLSGGFDTRISLALLLNSGIDLNKIQIFSIKGELHTYKEDYEIASKIATHYGFKLNQTLPAQKFLNYNLTDFFNFDSYGNQLFSNIPKFWLLKKNIDKRYHISGMSGETLRHRWQLPPEEFTKDFIWKVSFYSSTLSQKLTVSIKNILESSLNAVRDKHKFEEANFKNIQQLLYHETWSRYHFGKESLCNYLAGIVKLSPALDPEVRILRLDTSKCPDYNFLITLLFARYAPDLLKFPLDLNRSIAPETIAYAQKINERFPRQVTADKSSGGGPSILFTAA